jgi:hypothetical protein
MKILTLSAQAAFILLASPVLAATASPAAPVSGGALAKANGVPAYTYPAYHSHDSQKRNAILAVREEGLKVQAADGGKLTEEHRAYLQAKLDAALHGNY